LPDHFHRVSYQNRIIISDFVASQSYVHGIASARQAQPEFFFVVAVTTLVEAQFATYKL
jgi:hypothetical protein